jgi:hypothetical protein
VPGGRAAGDVADVDGVFTLLVDGDQLSRGDAGDPVALGVQVGEPLVESLFGKSTLLRVHR